MSRGQVKDICVVQLARFGDFLQTTPLLAALKKAHPKARLNVVVNTTQAELAWANPDVDEVAAVNVARLEAAANNPGRRLSDRINSLHDVLSPLMDRPCDLAINLNTSGLAALVAELIPATDRRGAVLGQDRKRLIPAPWAGFIMSLMANRRLIRFNLVDLLASYADVTERVSDGLVYPLADEDIDQGRELLGPIGAGPCIGFQMGSRHESRQWPVERFATLASLLIKERGATIYLLGMQSEAGLGQAMQAALVELNQNAGRNVVNLMGRTSIRDLGGVLKGLDLLVTSDTGTMHLAAAVRTRILALFIGPAFCHETGPYGRGHIIMQTVTPCSPCIEGQAPCEGDHWCRQLIRPNDAARLAGWILDGDGSVPDIAPGPMVHVLQSAFDDWGVVYEPVITGPLTGTEVMALAYREAGRRYIRPGYRPDFFQAAEKIARLGLESVSRISELLSALGQAGYSSFRQLGRDPDLEPLARMLPGIMAERPDAARLLLSDVRSVLEEATQPGSMGHLDKKDEHGLPSGTKMASDILSRSGEARR